LNKIEYKGKENIYHCFLILNKIMKKYFHLSVVIIATLTILSACNSVDKKTPLLPKDATFVVHLNTNSLSSKLSWDEVKKSNWFAESTHDEKDSLVRSILEDPSSSGIETKEGLFVFARREANGGYSGFTGYVKDLAAFEAFNKKLSRSNEVKTNKDLKIISFGDYGIVSWNENKFLYLIGSDKAFAFSMGPRPSQEEPKRTDLSDAAYRIFHYKKDSLLIDDSRFASLLKDEGDVHFWSNAESMSMDNMNMGFMSLMKTEVYFRETVTASTITFEKGKVVAHAKTYSNKEVTELMKKYSGDNINTDYIKRIPSDNVIGVFAANIKPEGIKQLLKLGGLDGLVNSFLGEHGLTLDQVVAATKGDVMITLTDFGVRKKMIKLGEGMDSLPVNSRGGEVLLCMTINDKAPFQKLADAVQTAARSNSFPLGFTVKIENDLFVAGTNPAMIDQYLKGGKKDFPFVSRMSGHPAALYGNLESLFTSILGSDEGIGSGSRDSTGTKTILFKDVLGTGGEFKDGAIVQDVEFTMPDPNTNSLPQINSFVDQMSSKRKKPF